MGNSATRRPWFVDDRSDRPSLVTIYADMGDDGTKCIASIGNGEPWADALSEWRDNASLICRAVNQHESLIKCAEALRVLLRATVASEPIDDEQLFKALTESRAALLSLEESSK